MRAFSDDGAPVANSRLFKEILQELARYPDAVAIAHSEELPLSAGGLLHEGAVSRRLGLPAVPAAAETIGVARDILLAAATGARLHLAHLSTAGSVELLAWARERGLPVTAEVTPHHLLLTDEEILRSGALAKVNPPLRTEDDCRVLQEALRTGLIDIIATDHAPHRLSEKEAGLEEAPCGIAGLETAVPLLLTGLVNRGKLSLRIWCGFTQPSWRLLVGRQPAAGGEADVRCSIWKQRGRSIHRLYSPRAPCRLLLLRRGMTIVERSRWSRVVYGANR